MLSPNTILKERYRIIQPLGRGGQGAVYQAMDEGANRLVAVKQTFATDDQLELRRAFRREADLLAGLQHPSLPFVIEHFREGNGQFLVMQFIPGNNLQELLRLRERPFPADKVLEWADQLLDALEELHGNEPPVIHRDIKPANLKLTPKGKIILLDFGMAKGFIGDMSTLEEGRSLSSLHGGTLHYAPLEQLQHKGTDPRSDIYSLGATLWTLMTNSIPPTALTRLADQGEGNPDPLRPAHELNPAVPPPVSEVLHQAMSIYRQRRPETAADMRRALREAARLASKEQRREGEQLAAERARQQAGTLIGAEAARHDAEAGPGEAGKARADDQQEGPPSAAPVPAATPPPDDLPAAIPPETEAGPDVRTRDDSAVTEKTVNTAPAAPRMLPAQPGVGGLYARRVVLPVLALVIVAAAAGLTKLLIGSGSGESGSTANTARQQPGRQASNALGNAGASPTPGVMTQAQATPPGASPAVTPEPPPGMVYVPGGTFTMGRNDGDEYERPAHQVTVGPFFIDKYEVTNEEYAKFVREKNWLPPPTWKGKTYPPGAGRKPVTGVKWGDAVAYAKWAGKRLPTEREWEFAARGTDGRLYPWGNEWRAGLANANKASAGMADVGAYKGASFFGALDMVGNAWEWTATTLSPYPKGRLPISVNKNLKVIRGGSYDSNPNQATTTYRRGWRVAGEEDYDNTGFRCAKGLGGS